MPKYALYVAGEVLRQAVGKELEALELAAAELSESSDEGMEDASGNQPQDTADGAEQPVGIGVRAPSLDTAGMDIYLTPHPPSLPLPFFSCLPFLGLTFLLLNTLCSYPNTISYKTMNKSCGLPFQACHRLQASSSLTKANAPAVARPREHKAAGFSTPIC